MLLVIPLIKNSKLLKKLVMKSERTNLENFKKIVKLLSYIEESDFVKKASIIEVFLYQDQGSPNFGSDRIRYFF